MVFISPPDDNPDPPPAADGGSGDAPQEGLQAGPEGAPPEEAAHPEPGQAEGDTGAAPEVEILDEAHHATRDAYRGLGSRTCPLCNIPIAPGSRVQNHPQGRAHYSCPRGKASGGGGA